MSYQYEIKKYSNIIVGGIIVFDWVRIMWIDKSCTLADKLTLNVGLNSSNILK